MRAYYKKEGFTRKAIDKTIAEARRSQSIIDRKGYSWEIKNGEPVFIGHGACYPTKEAFNLFLAKYGFPLIGEVDSNFGFPSCKEFALWNKVFHIFSYLARVGMGIDPGEYGGSQDLLYDFCREHVKSNKYSPIHTKHMVPFNNLHDTVIACLYVFWERHTDLHSRLRQCQCCGRFWMAENKTRDVFCGKVCKNKFHESSREDNKKRVKTIRADNREYQKEEDVKKLVEWLENKEGYTPEEAKSRAHKLAFIYGETFKNYTRKSGQKYGL